MPDLYNAQFTRFEREQHCVFPGQIRPVFPEYMVPVHYIKEWQWPKRAAGSGDAPEFKTVRISEHKWPLKGAFNCRCDGPWPHDEHPIVQMDRMDLIAANLIMPWWNYPLAYGEPTLPLDGAAWVRHSRGPQGANDRLPDDYLEFWLMEEDEDDYFANLEAA